MSEQKKGYLCTAIELVKLPKKEAEQKLDHIRKTMGDAEADAIVGQISAAMREIQKQN